MQRQRSVFYALFLLLFPSVHLSARTQPPAYLKEYQRKGLPPIDETIDFEDKATFPLM